MIEVRTVDLSGLEQFNGAFARAVGISTTDAIEYQGGLLMQDLTKAAAPRSLSKSKQRAEKGVNMVFAVTPKSNLSASQRSSKFSRSKKAKMYSASEGEMQWIYAAPMALVGAKKSLFIKDTGAGGLYGVSRSDRMSLLYKANQGKMGKKWNDMGVRKRGFFKVEKFGRGRKGGKATTWVNIQSRQHVMSINRYLVPKSVHSKFVKSIQDTFGRLKASFALGVNQIRVKFTIPEWINRHIMDRSAKGSFDFSKEPVAPTMTITSNQSGCESDASLTAIRAALHKRLASIKKDIKLYWSGIKNADDFRKQTGFAAFSE